MKSRIKEVFKLYYEDFFLSLILIFFFSSLSCVVLKLSSLASFFHKVGFLLVIFWFIFDLFVDIISKKYTYFKNKKILLCLVLFFSISFFTFLALTLDNLKYGFYLNSFAQLTKPILFISSLIMALQCVKIKFKKLPFLSLKYLTLFLSILIIVLFIAGPARTWETTTQWERLTLNFSNPNAAALVLSVLISIMIYFFIVSKSLVERIFIFINGLFLFVLVYFTSSRNSLISFGVLFVFCILYKFIKNKNFSFSTFIVCLPGITLGIYFLAFMIYTKGDYYLPDLESKGIASRFVIWCKGLSLINWNPFCCNYFICSTKSGWYHMHNCFLDVTVSYGLVVLVLLIVYFCVVVFDCINIKTGSKKHKMFCLGVFTCLFSLGMFESIPFYSTNGLALIALSFIGVAKTPFGKSIFEEEDIQIAKKDACDLLIINNVYGYGSTGKIVQDLHLGCLKKNIKSYVIYGRNRNKSPHDINTVCVESILEVRLCQILNRLFKTQSLGYYYMTSQIIYSIKHLKPKIVCIHGLNDNFVNYKKLLMFLSRNNIKTVYTNHSEYMFIGNCGGYAYECNKFISGSCKNCHKGNKINKISGHKVFNTKFDIINSFNQNNFAVTSVSPWLNVRSSNSLIFKSYRNFVIYNGTRICNFEYKKEFKNPYEIKKDIILLVTPSLTDERKGFKYFEELARLNIKNKKIHFVAISIKPYNKEVPENLSIINNVSDSNLLSLYYYFAKVTVLTSKRETYSMPLVESLCCGTPIIGFEAGGPESIGIKEYTKFVPYGDVAKLNKLLNEFLTSKPIKKETIMKKAQNKYSVSMMVNSFLNVYKVLGVDLLNVSSIDTIEKRQDKTDLVKQKSI